MTEHVTHVVSAVLINASTPRVNQTFCTFCAPCQQRKIIDSLEGPRFMYHLLRPVFVVFDSQPPLPLIWTSGHQDAAPVRVVPAVSAPWLYAL